MAYEQRDNSGSLFPNTKRPGKQDADYRGSVKVDGKDFWISLWKKEKDGKPWLSISLTPKVKTENRPAEPKDNLDLYGDSEIPF